MKKIIIALLLFVPFMAISQQVKNTANSNVKFRDTTGFGGSGSASLAKAFIDMSKAPYSLTAGANGSASVQLAVDSLWNTYRGGTVYIPMNLNWPRPNGASQKGVVLRPNINIVGNGNRLSMTGNCAFFTTDFGTDSLGTTITADVDSFMTNITVASSAGFAVNDTIYFRLTTAPYDAGEPLYFGYRKVRAIPDGTHITLDAPTGGLCTVASTSSLNKRIIRIHNLATNINISNLELYNDGNVGGGHVCEAGIYIQGGWNIKMSNIRATNPGAGIAVMQFCVGCTLENSRLDSAANTGNANFGRGITINECEICGVINTEFNNYQQTALVNESSNINSFCYGCTFNNNFNDSIRKAITNLGSGTFTFTNTRFKGFKSTAFDQVFAIGNSIFQNTLFQKGTPITMYEQAGLNIQPPYLQSDGNYYVRKSFTHKFTIPVNATYSFDSLPKGLMLNFKIEVDNISGITACYLRRDNSFTNNQTDMTSSLVAGKAVYPSGLGATFQVGNNMATTALNYNEDKGFLITTNSSGVVNNTGTISFDYLEKDGSTLLNRYNAMTYYDGRTFTGAGSLVYGTGPTFLTSILTPKIKGSSSAPAITAGAAAGTGPTVSVSGTDVAGLISVTTGTGTTTGATVATITYNVAYGTQPFVILIPANLATAALANGVVYVSHGSSGASSFVLNSTGAAPAASTAYQWYYHVIQ